jgi:hypothetical protein
MKKNQIINLCVFAFLMLPLLAHGQRFQLPDNFYKKFQGFIRTSKAELPITLDLYVLGDSFCEGTYSYDKIKKPIYVSGRVDNQGNLQLIEYLNEKVTGTFSGKFKDRWNMSGIWMTPDSTSRYEFELKENYPQGSAHFEIFHIHKQLGDCETENCFTIDIIFPALVDYQDEAVQDRINLGIGADWEKQQKIVQEEVELFNDESEMYEDIGYTMNWYEYYEEKIVLNSNYILSFERFSDTYTGGAHGSHIYDLINFDLSTGDTISLDDIFIDNYEDALNDIADVIFRKDNEIGADEDLTEIGYWGLENGFHVNKNFLLTMDGVCFIFNEYEIAPYAAGAIELFIPYTKITHLIKLGSLVEPLLNR